MDKVIILVLLTTACVYAQQQQQRQQQQQQQRQQQQGQQVFRVTKAEECTKFPCLIFEDTFDTLDLEKWEHEISAHGNGNWEFQTFVNNRTNSFVKDGKLFIRPTLTEDQYGEGFVQAGSLDLWGAIGSNDVCTSNQFFGCYREGPGFDQGGKVNEGEIINPVQSARLRTLKSFNFKYGHVDVVAKLPVGDWLWPAIKLLPVHTAYGKWPASGEIDIVESRGNNNVTGNQGQQLGNDIVQQTLHWGPYWQINGFFRTIAGKPVDKTKFHKYSVRWGPNDIRFFIDDAVVMEVDPLTGFFDFGEYSKFLDIDNPWANGGKLAPFDKDFFLVVSLAVGGTNGYFSDFWSYDVEKPWKNFDQFPMKSFYEAKDKWLPTWQQGDDSTLQVDSIRVWKLEP